MGLLATALPGSDLEYYPIRNDAESPLTSYMASQPAGEIGVWDPYLERGPQPGLEWPRDNA